MRKSTILATLVSAAFVAGMLTACDDNKNNNRNWNGGGLGAGVTINVEGAVAEGGDGGDGGNAANQGGQIGQDGSAVIDADLETITPG